MSKSKYGTHVLPYIDRIAEWVRQGATIKEVAKKLHVGYSSFFSYLERGKRGEDGYQVLADAFARACEEPDDNVEAALYKRACGYEYTEVKVEQKVTRDGDIYELTTRLTRDVPPDPTSAMFWLTNRRRDKWQYKPVPEQGDEDDGSGVVLIPAVEEQGRQDGKQE